MKRIGIIILCGIMLAFAASCDKSLEATYSKQDKNIEALVSSLTSQNEDATVEYLGGTVRVTVVQGEGEALRKDGSVSFYYAGHYVNGSSLNVNNLFATNYELFASTSKWNVTDTTAFTIKTLTLSEEKVVEGLKTGLEGVRAGDECYVIFNGKHGFGKGLTGIIPSNSALAYHLWIRGVSN